MTGPLGGAGAAFRRESVRASSASAGRGKGARRARACHARHLGRPRRRRRHTLRDVRAAALVIDLEHVPLADGARDRRPRFRRGLRAARRGRATRAGSRSSAAVRKVKAWPSLLSGEPVRARRLAALPLARARMRAGRAPISVAFARRPRTESRSGSRARRSVRRQRVLVDVQLGELDAAAGFGLQLLEDRLDALHGPHHGAQKSSTTGVSASQDVLLKSGVGDLEHGFRVAATGARRALRAGGPAPSRSPRRLLPSTSSTLRPHGRRR